MSTGITRQLGNISKMVLSDRDNLGRAMNDIREELRLRLEHFQRENMLVEAQRLEQKTQ